MTIGKSCEKGVLKDAEVREVVEQAVARLVLSGKKVLAIVPDGTRTAPVALFYRLLTETIGKAAQKLDFLVALGTHPAMSQEKIDAHLGRKAGEREKHRAFNHAWDDPSQLKHIGTISEDEIEKASGGLLREDVAVSVNKLIFDYDLLVIVGPTFPHEVVGFSGGNKYFFPGISGPKVLHFFHWLGALITNQEINGTKSTPVRKVIDRAAAMITVPKLCLSLVVTHDGLKGVFAGSPEEAYSDAADLSARVHIVYKDRRFKKILSVCPGMYDDLWTGAKCMYKLEPVVEDGGEIIIYAPHIKEISPVHGRILEEIGYHTRDYFVKQMDRFRDVPRGTLAHSTHVRGMGTYEDGVEKPRINVTVASGISEELCRKINLGYRDPAEIDPAEWEGREDEGILLVPRAGEILYRLKR